MIRWSPLDHPPLPPPRKNKNTKGHLKNAKFFRALYHLDPWKFQKPVKTDHIYLLENFWKFPPPSYVRDLDRRSNDTLDELMIQILHPFVGRNSKWLLGRLLGFWPQLLHGQKVQEKVVSLKLKEKRCHLSKDAIPSFHFQGRFVLVFGGGL